MQKSPDWFGAFSLAQRLSARLGRHLPHLHGASVFSLGLHRRERIGRSGGHAQPTTAAALALLVLAWLPLGLGMRYLGWLIAGVVQLDLGGQAVHVLNQSLIFRLRPEAHSRLVGVCMRFYETGCGLGALA
jgi:hypothetical protein